MPDIFETLSADWHRDTHAVAETMRHLMHHGAPQQPETCGQCQDGVIPVSGCTCGDGLPPYGHEPGCGFEPCPNGCWDILHPHGAPQPAALAPSTAVPHNGTQEVTPMSLNLAAVEEHIKAAFDEFQAVDRQALAKLDAVTANPATSVIFEDLAAIAHLPLTSGELSTAESVLKMTLGLLGGTVQPQAADVPQAAGPVIAGQA